MGHNYTILIVKDGEKLQDNTDDGGIVPTMQSGLREGQTIFILWSKIRPLIEGSRIITEKACEGAYRALSVTKSGIHDVQVNDIYDIEQFDLFILYSGSAGGWGTATAAIATAKDLTAHGVNCKDILMITGNESPFELYSDADLYGVVCINRISDVDVIKKEMQFFAGLFPNPDIPESGGQERCTERQGNIPLPEKCGEANTHKPLYKKGLGLDAYALAGFILMVLVYAATQSSPYLLKTELRGGPQVKREVIQREEVIQKEIEEQHSKPATKEAFVALDPLVIRFAGQGGVLRMKVQLQLSDAAYRPIAANNSSRLRNAIIACLKDQPVRSISCAEGKSRLKGRIIRKANQTVGKNIFKHLYFNEFVLLGRENTMRLQPVMVIGRSAVKREL